MNVTLLRFLARRHWLSVLLCSLAPVAIGVVIGLLYPTFSRQRALLEMARGVARFFSQGQMEPFSPEGACSFPLQHPLCLVVVALAAAIAPTTLPAGERGTRGLDVLLATPLTRRELIASVAAFGVVVAAWFGITGFAGAMLTGGLAGVLALIDTWAFAVAALNLSALCMFLGALALVVSVVARDRGNAALMIGSLSAIALIIDVIARLWADGQWLRYLSPYGYFRPADVVSATGSVGAGLLASAALIAAALILTGAAWWMESRRLSV